ncbi:MAG: LysE family transporter [Bacteroidota bacterium]|nr:LysE family transporter [Bacteroidota bacterium]
MYEAVFQGIMMGLILSTFCGPIFFMLINLGISSTLRSVIYLAFGVFLSDMIIIFLLLYVALGSISELKYLEILYYIGGAVLIYFGVRNLLKTPVIMEPEEDSQKRLNTLFIKGFMINSLNPTIFFFWFGAMMLAFSSYHNDKNLVLTHFICGLGVTLLTDCLKGYSAFHLKKYVKPGFLKVLNIFSGIIIIGFGLKLIFFH